MEFYAAVGCGMVSNMSRVAALGHALNLTTSTTYDLYPNAATTALYPFPVAATQMQVVSTSANDTAAGSGMRTVTVIGLDASFNPLSEVVTMNGTTPVTTVNSYYRINTFIGRTAGTPQIGNAGTISLKTLGGGAILAQMEVFSGVGNSFGSAAVYTVPNGFSALINDINFSEQGSPASFYGTVALATCMGGLASGAPVVMALRRDINSSFPIQQPLSEGLLLTQGSDVSVRVLNLGQSGSEISAGFQILLINNSYLAS